MTNKSRLQTQRPGVFSSALRRENVDGSKALIHKTNEDLESLSIATSDYFLYDSPDNGVRNTQQLPIDFSKFENHTFFNSAQANVNVAFDNIVNKFPFDGTRIEYENYLNGLTGFENYVLSQFPKNMGFLLFSGSAGAAPTEGTYIKVLDFKGSQFTEFSKDKSGSSALNPEKKSFSLECVMNLTPAQNENQVIFQKISGSNLGFTLAVSQSSSTSQADLIFGLSSGSVKLFTSASVLKDSFNHVVASYDRTIGQNNLKLYVNQDLVASSSGQASMKVIPFDSSTFLIGSGTTHESIGMSGDTNFIPAETFTGSLDEVRFFHSLRSENQQKKFANRNVFPDNDLKLYFKFNEPSGTFGNNALVLDSSGNSLHSLITNYVAYMRETGSLGIGLTQENPELNPVLFPKYSGVQNLNVDLLTTASNYDDENPNLITKLVPPHYFDEGFSVFGFKNFDQPLAKHYSGSNLPGSGDLGSSQILSAILYVWAKHFDEIKSMTDHMSQITHVGYDAGESAADQFLPFVSRYFGFDLPPIFTNGTPEQFYHNQDLNIDFSNNKMSLMQIRNGILRRILSNVGETIRSKGTVHSVKTVLRSFGLDPDLYVRIKEFGGPKSFSLSDLRYNKAVISSEINFSGTLSAAGSTDAQGVFDNRPFLRSGFLTGSRIEVGKPKAAGTFVSKGTTHESKGFGYHGISNDPDDGLFTSGSWTYEAIYKFPKRFTHNLSSSIDYPLSQSLARLHVTGSGVIAPFEGVVANMLLMSGSGDNNDGAVTLWVRNNTSGPSIATLPSLKLTIPFVSVSNGETWNFSFGRERAEYPVVSSSYFLRCAKQSNGIIDEIFTTSSFYMEDPTADFSNNVFQNKSANFNSSGSFVVIGSQNIGGHKDFFLNNTNENEQARVTDFAGNVSNIKFWSKSLTINEWKEHVRNPDSLGVQNPDLNFSFVTQETGSFERLRLNLACDQPVTASDATGKIQIIDFSQNDLNGQMTGFAPSIDVFQNEKRFTSIVSPNFDENLNSVKVRPRSFNNQENIEEFNASSAPMFEIPRDEEPQDDPRFSLEFSIADALNEDISKMFANLDAIDNALGSANLEFEEDYPDLETLRDIYFNRLTEKINIKQFFEFYKWFDSSIGVLIEQLMPKKANFLGVNFVVEPHALERGKLRRHTGNYYTTDHYTPGDVSQGRAAGAGAAQDRDNFPDGDSPDNPNRPPPNTFDTQICDAYDGGYGGTGLNWSR